MMTIEDVTNSLKIGKTSGIFLEELGLSYQLDQEDWQDHQKYLDRLKINRYVEDVIEGKTHFKNENPIRMITSKQHAQNYENYEYADTPTREENSKFSAMYVTIC